MNIHKSLHKIVREREKQRRKYQRVKSLVVLMIALFLGIFIGNVFLQNNNISITGFVASGSLPNVGGSTDNWGNILNDYLLQEHTSTGAHGNVTAENLTVDGDVNVTGNANITGNLSVGDKITFRFGEVIDNIVDGVLRITGDLNISGVVNSTGLNVNGTVKADNYLDSSGNTAGTMVLLETQTADNDSTIDFTGLDGTYDEYVVKGISVVPANNIVELLLRVSINGTFKSGSSDYSWTSIFGTDGTVADQDDNLDNGIRIHNGLGNDIGESVSFTLHVPEPSNTNLIKNIYGDSQGLDSNSARIRRMFGGDYNGASATDTSAIDGFQILFDSGNISSGTFKLYGIK